MTPGKGSVLTEKQSLEIERLLLIPQRTEKQGETLRALIAKRDAPPELSDTAKSYLRELYIFHKYGKETVGGSERSKYTMKGTSVEDNSIKLLSRLHNSLYIKNIDTYKNDYICGTPDIVVKSDEGFAQKIIDIKSSWDGASLLSNLGAPLNQHYYYQLQGYMALTGATKAEVCYCLVSMPDEIINGEKKRIWYIMNPPTEENVDYKKAIQKLEDNMTFDEIPEKERIISFKVDRDESVIEKIYERVVQCREWLKDFEKSHLSENE
jgi:hypothetical protein